MFTPHRTVLALRVLTASAVGVLVILTVGPFQGLEARLGLSDKAAHVVAFYIVTLLAFAIAPRFRRMELALMVFGLGVLIELAQGLVGRSLSLSDVVANSAGIVAAAAPAWIERLRFLARRSPYLSFKDAIGPDRRRRGGRAKAEGVAQLKVKMDQAGKTPSLRG